MLVEKVKKKRQWFKFVFLIVLLLGAVSTVLFLALSNTTIDYTTEKVPEPKKQPVVTEVSSNVLFLGNTFWGRYIDDWSKASSLGYAYPFSRLNEFDRTKYDAWISGLECPVANGINMTSAEMEQELQFNCSPEYLPEAAKWFTAFTLANNHTDNHGPEGFAQTQQNLEANGIQYFGHYDYSYAPDVCEIVSIPAKVSKDDGSVAEGELPIALCGYHGVFGVPTDETVAEIAKYSPYMPVIAMPHMGAEYQPAPDEIKTSFYHSLIDAGADMVLGDHPHWIQNTESYNGHLIVYSMGNFMFDQQFNSEVTRSAAIKVYMKTNNVEPQTLEKWLALSPSCKVFKDDCLDQIINQSLSKLDISYGFAVVGSNDDQQITKPATEEQMAEILDRLNWSSTMQQLQAPYSSL